MPEQNSNLPPTYVDLHAHSAHSRFNEGVPYAPEELIDAAVQSGLGGIALTGHDTLAGIEEAIVAAQNRDLMLIPGVEIMTRKGLHVPHMVGLLPTAVALEMATRRTKLPRFKSPDYTADWIHDHGGVVIAPHPRPDGNIISLSYPQVHDLGERIDAIETHTTRGINDAVMRFAQERGIASVGSSDAHRLEEVGLARTAVHGEIRTADDVIQAIKDRRVGGVIDKPIPTALQGERDVKSLIQSYRTKKRI
jgi:predicted metal-dependent phosphoesterase TrpH